MRVLSSLLMLLGVAGVSAQTAIVFDPATTSNGWKVVNNANLNPAVTVTAGTTTTFDISQIPPAAHPFLFSTSSSTGSVVLDAPIAENGPAYKVWSSAGCTNVTGSATASSKFSTTGGTGSSATPLNTCVVSLWANTTAAGNTIYYRCGVHNGMVGTITIGAAAAGTTNPPTTAAPAGPLTGQTLSGTSFKIIAGDITNGWTFSDGGKQYLNPTLSVTPGTTLTFSLEYPQTPAHPFGLSPKNDNAVNADQTYFPDDLNGNTKTQVASACTKTVPTINAYTTTTTGTPCVITVPVPGDAGGKTVYYRCALHQAMKGTIVVKNAAAVVGAGMALVIAVMTALFA
jgi:hypothetical protein